MGLLPMFPSHYLPGLPTILHSRALSLNSLFSLVVSHHRVVSRIHATCSAPQVYTLSEESIQLLDLLIQGSLPTFLSYASPGLGKTHQSPQGSSSLESRESSCWLSMTFSCWIYARALARFRALRDGSEQVEILTVWLSSCMWETRLRSGDRGTEVWLRQ